MGMGITTKRVGTGVGEIKWNVGLVIIGKIVIA